MSAALHCLTRTLLQADQIIRELRAAAIDGISLITSARCTCGKQAGIGPVGAFLAKSGIDEMAAIDMPVAGRCVVGGNLLPILFGFANASRHACVPEGLVELGLSAADAAYGTTMIAQGWTLIHVPVTTPRALTRIERIFTNAGAASISNLRGVLAEMAVRVHAHSPAGEAWVSAVRPAHRVTVNPAATGSAVLAEASWQ